MAWKKKNERLCLNNKFNFPVTERKHCLHHYLVIFNATQWLWHVCKPRLNCHSLNLQKSSILVKLYCHFKLNCLEVLLLCTPKKKGEIFARILHILARWENSHLEKQNFKNRSITPNQGRTLFSFNWNITSIYLREISFLLQIIYLWIFIIY